MRRVLVVLVLVAMSLIFTTARPAWACSCAVTSPGLKAADLAFVGVADDVDKPWSAGGNVVVKVRFSVESVQKGTAGAHAEVTTNSEGPACGFEFVKGYRYQVYSNQGATDSCIGNQQLARAYVPETHGGWWWSLGLGTLVLAGAAAVILRRRRAQ
jgi:hypothetical protein